MRFNHFLTTYMPDAATGGGQIYRDMVEQAVQAERCGYSGVSIPEHHLINILMIPSPLQMAVKIASVTTRIELVTSVAVLPIRDMRIFAGEVVQASLLTDGRLTVGVGRGAFAWELERLGLTIADCKARLDESLDVLEALLTRENVGWEGTHYRFEPITIMPRPEHAVPLMIAVMIPEGIEACAARGLNVQTTPLGASHEVLMTQVNAWRRGLARSPNAARQRLSLQRGIYCAADRAEARRVLESADAYYSRFDNVWSGPGQVDSGMIRPLPRAQSIEDLGKSLVICEASEMIERLSAYREAGIDEVIVSSNFGQPQRDTLAMMDRFAEKVMPWLGDDPARSVA